ncbi:MAG: type IV pilus modification protein PilV [Gammaproteobacteria bacterium]|nr:type IV pilus modification protein PilV [Gammaproteobacteria bacterium]
MLVKNKIQQGVTLIEAMIALLVISVGLLGIASLQITAMSQNASSLNHSQAVWFAYNMSDRIRANTAAQFNNYNGINTSTGYTQDCMTLNCSDAQMVVADAADWETMVETLPSGQGIITSSPDAILGTVLQVTVMWDDDGTGAGGTNCGPDPAVDLTCYTLTVAP